MVGSFTLEVKVLRLLNYYRCYLKSDKAVAELRYNGEVVCKGDLEALRSHVPITHDFELLEREINSGWSVKIIKTRDDLYKDNLKRFEKRKNEFMRLTKLSSCAFDFLISCDYGDEELVEEILKILLKKP